MPTGPKPFVDDGNSFSAIAGVPAITHGPRGGTAHRLGMGRDRRFGPHCLALCRRRDRVSVIDEKRGAEPCGVGIDVKPGPSNQITASVPRPEQSSSSSQSKLVLAVFLLLWVSVPYFGIQRWTFFPVRVMQPGPIDRAIPFFEETAWLYLSIYLLVAVVVWALPTPRDLGRFGLDAAFITLVSHLIFLFCPTSVTRPSEPATDLAYRLVVQVDQSLNACPSLHASMGVYSALWCHRLAAGRRAAWLYRAGAWTWTLAILYATLAVRQHVLTDLLAGAFLATVVFAVSGRSAHGKTISRGL